MLIAEKLGIPACDIYSADKITAETIAPYEALILGTSTWGLGQLQDDWAEAIGILSGCDLSGKYIALFGCGDSVAFSDTFCDGIGILYNELKDKGCTFIGMTAATDYSYTSSAAEQGDELVGLAIDEVNEGALTERRVTAWTAALKSSL